MGRLGAESASVGLFLGMHLDNWLAQRAATCPDRPALLAGGYEVAYAELEREAVRAARRLAAKGVRRGSTVAIELAAGLDYVVLLHALMKLGAVAYPLNTRLAGPEREAELARAGPGLVISSAADAGQAEADLPLLGEHDLDALCCRILTGGSSGRPRPVGLTYGNHLWSAVGSAFNLGVEPTDRWLCCLPLYHVSGFSIVMRSVIYGTTAVVHEGFDPVRIAESLEGDGITVISVVATQLMRLLEAGVDLLPLRAVLVGGGPVPRDVLEEAIGRGATVVQTYGLTEAASQVTTLSPTEAQRKLGSAGRPLLTTHLRIQQGEILVQGPTVAPGAADEDGWLHTGDLGRQDDDGYFYVVGRTKEMIIRGGYNVYPREVEEVLYEHPAVREAAVIGLPDADLGEEIGAAIVLRDNETATEAELSGFVRERLAAYKYPRLVWFRDQLPKGPTGKILKREISPPAAGA
jgi:O-succinylbenzoic acid--CoA ligase